MSYENAGQVLKKFRNTAGLTQEELSKIIKVHPQYISNHERGKCLPPGPAMKKIYKEMSAEMQDSFTEALKCDLISSYLRKIGVKLK